MTIKLTSQQAEALKRLFDAVIIPESAVDVAESLVKDLMKQIYRKLRAKLEGKKKDGYSLALTDTEAKAYYIYFQNRSLPSGWVYEQNFIDKQMMELDKAYA